MRIYRARLVKKASWVMLMGILMCSLTGFAQQDTMFKKGYLYFKPVENHTPLQAIFVEKSEVRDAGEAFFKAQFNLQKDTGVFLIMQFLDTTAAQRAVFDSAMQIKLWSSISISENGIVNTYRHEMKVIPVKLKVSIPRVSFSEMAMDDFILRVSGNDGPVIENCRHQTQEFGIVKNIYRLDEE